MKKLMLFVLSCAACLLLCSSVFAQGDVTGTYQGTLAVGKGLRLVVKISKAPDGSLTSNVFSIDQGGAALPVKSTTLTGNVLKIDQPALSASFEGKVSPDFKTITGTFTQGSPFPLVLTRATPDTAWVIPEAPKPVPPMAKDANPAFEVATIKPSAPDAKGKGIGALPNGETRTVNTSLDDLIGFAYGVQVKQIVGGTEWMETDKYDLTGKPDTAGTPDDRQFKLMLQKLLAERFGLKFHREPKQLSAYVLTAPQGAEKLKVNDSGGTLPGLFFRIGNGVTLNVQNALIVDFTDLLQGAVVDRPVVNRTGLTGRYDFQLKFTPDDSMMGGLGLKLPPTPEGQEAPPGLFAAIPAQLGLKIEAEKTAVSALVIDHVNKPTDN
jgi:uncharacterized protein (TIGR03435 family)